MADGPVFDQVNVIVDDMDAAVEFYRQLGCEVGESGEEWDAHHRNVTTPAGLDFDLDSAEFAKVWCRGWDETMGRATIGFRLPSREAVDEKYAELTAAGYTGLMPPWDAFWGARHAIVRDPVGNPVSLQSPRDPARTSAGPSPPFS